MRVLLAISCLFFFSKPTSSNEKTDDENVRKASDELSRMALGKSLRIEDPNEADTVEEGRDELMEEDETDTVVVKKRNKCFLQVRQSQFVLTTCPPCFTFVFY